jgi:hypothetical protein
MPAQVIYIALAILLFALFPLPYGYYSFVRIIITSVFVWAAYISHKRSPSSLLPWISIIIAVLFNPINPIYLSKGIWRIIDIMVIAILLINKNRIRK